MTAAPPPMPRALCGGKGRRYAEFGSIQLRNEGYITGEAWEGDDKLLHSTSQPSSGSLQEAAHCFATLIRVLREML